MAVRLKQKWQILYFSRWLASLINSDPFQLFKTFSLQRWFIIYQWQVVFITRDMHWYIAAILLLLSIVLIFLLWILKISATVHEEHWNFISIFWKPSNLTLKSLKHPYSPLKQTRKIFSVLADQLSGQSQNPCTAWSRCSEYKIECEFIIHCSA